MRNNPNKIELQEIKQKAFALYMESRYDQKTIAQMVGVSDTTLSKWQKTGKWNILLQQRLTAKSGVDAFLIGFRAYLERNAPELVQKLNDLYNAFLKEGFVIPEGSQTGTPVLAQ